MNNKNLIIIVISLALHCTVIDALSNRSKYELEQKKLLSSIERKKQLRDKELTEQIEKIKAKSVYAPQPITKKVIKKDPITWVQEELEPQLKDLTRPNKITYQEDAESVDALFNETNNDIDIDTTDLDDTDKAALFEQIRKGIDNFVDTLSTILNDISDPAIKKYLTSSKFHVYQTKLKDSKKQDDHAKPLFKKIDEAYHFLIETDYAKTNPTAFKNSLNKLVAFSKNNFNHTPS